MGIYQITLSVVGVLVTLTASGTPITVSRLMLKFRTKGDKLSEQQVVSSGIFTALAISVPITVALFIFKPFFCNIFADPRCYDILLVILPSIVLTSVYAVIRGVFWGNKNFLLYAIIELVEEVAMLGFGVVLVLRADSVFSRTLNAGIAISLSYILSFAISTFTFVLQGGKLKNPVKQMGALLESSLPITAMRTLSSLVGTLVAIIIPERLMAIGLSRESALSSYGELSGMALPLLFMPSTIIGSMALVLVPDLAENFYKKNYFTLKTTISSAIKCSVLIASFIFPVFIALGTEIGTFIYANKNAGKMLSVSSVLMIPMCITMITTSILNSLNLEKKTLAIYLVGALFLLGSVWFLPQFCGVYALIGGHFLSFCFTAIFNLVILHKMVGKDIEYKKQTLFALGSAFTSALFGYFLKTLTINAFDLPLSIFISASGILLYNFIVMKVLGVFDVLKAISKR